MFEFVGGKTSYQIIADLIDVFSKETKAIAFGRGIWDGVSAHDRLVAHMAVRRMYSLLAGNEAEAESVLIGEDGTK